MDKQCFKCGLFKPLEEFYKHEGMADGHLNKCKECTKRESRSNREKNLEYYRKYDRDRYQANGQRDRSEPYGQANPEKQRAHDLVSRAVRKGKLVRPSRCSICGKYAKIEAHHSDYTKPLEVVWVCKACHWKLHKIINAMERVINIVITEEDQK